VRHYRERAAEIRLGNLDLHRDFSDVSVVAEVYARLVAHGRPGAVLNIATGRALHLKSIPPLLNEITGHAPALVTDPRFVRAGEPAVICGDISRLTAAIGPLPQKEFAQTLREMLAGA
jgi:nucleoside-diphosphate-sugar epimerase